MRGRPSKIFDTERVDMFLKLIEDGVDFNIAADSARLARSTVFDWLRKGRDIQNNLEDSGELSIKEQAILDFLEQYMRARVAPEIKAVETVNRSIENGSWRAAAWLLENRFPDRWSEKRINGYPNTINQPENVVSSKQLEAKIQTVLEAIRSSHEG